MNGTSPAGQAARGRGNDGRRPPARRVWRVDEERHAYEPGGYDIQIEQPQLVIDSILVVVDDVRHPRPKAAG